MSDLLSKMYISLHVKYPLFFSDCSETWIFATDFPEILRYRISWKSAQWKPSWPTSKNGWINGTDRHDEANSRFSQFLRTRLKAEMPLKFTAKGTVKVNGIREAGESNRSIAENYDVHESTLRQRQGTGTVPTSLCRFKYKVPNEEEKELAEYCRDFDTRLCGQLSEC